VEDLVMLDATLGFFSDKTVLVTGHTGFKGAWLSRWLRNLGARVVGLSLAPAEQPNLFELAHVEQGISSIIGDIREPELVAQMLQSHCPEIVFHLAAQAIVRRSYAEPILTYATNVMGTLHVLEACRNVPSVRAVVIVTSDKCYENREWLWGYREIDALGGFDPYSSSKACAEIVTAAYRRSFFADTAAIASARAGNVIGGGDWCEDRLVPDIVRGVASGRPVVVRNPQAVRPWQHVLEPLAGYLMLARRIFEDRTYAEAYNFGPDDSAALPAAKLAEALLARLGGGKLELGAGAVGLHEAHLLKLDSSKARTRLGWSPRLDIDAALELTADWYRAYLRDPRSASDTLDRQIERYASGAS
jgi:CDP-glucose 4,6-dehydratase